MNGNRMEIQIDLEKNIYGSHMEVEESLFNLKIIVQLEMKLYGNHMEMEENLQRIRNISLVGDETVWKS